MHASVLISTLLIALTVAPVRVQTNMADISYTDLMKLRQATFDAEHQRTTIFDEGITVAMARSAR